MAVVSAPGILFGAVGTAGAFVEDLGALELFASDPPTPPSFPFPPPSTFGKVSSWQPLTLAVSAAYFHISMLMSLGFTKKIELPFYPTTDINLNLSSPY